ncbi:MAG: response regulator [Bacilli bacterium]|nr:response regulator [Bacilli bacterium]
MEKYLNFLNDIHIPIICLIFILIISYVFYRKSKLKTEENTVYSMLIISVICSMIANMICVFLMHKYPGENISKVLFTKIYLCLQLFYVVCLTYFLHVSTKNVRKDYCNLGLRYNRGILTFGVVITIIQSIIIMLLPIHFYVDNTRYFFRGPVMVFVFFMNIFYALIWIIKLSKCLYDINSNKLITYVIYIFLTFICFVLETIFPGVIINTFAIAFTLFLLYFTLDNPDIELINELEFTKKQTETAASAKDDFLSNMSHEIRTPLNAILGFSQLLSEKKSDDATKESIEEIEYSSYVLMDIVNGILDISKMEAGKFELYETDYSLNDIIKEVKQKMKIRARNKDVEVIFDISPNLPKVLFGDPLQVTQIMNQLLSNSIKFTEHGKVIFSIDSKIFDGECVLTISSEDTGIGIKEEDLEKIFKKFEKLETTKALKVEGAGLGLAITKRLVQMMHGTVMVQSVYGKGSKFTVVINQKISNAVIKDEKDLPALTDFTGKRILIVDDNPLNIKVVERLLKTFNCLTDSVASGSDCISKIKNHEVFDLIFMDDMMPELSGVDTLRKLRTIEGFNTKVIVLTANSSNGIKTKYIDDGFDDYLAKPINKDELSKILNKYLTK